MNTLSSRERLLSALSCNKPDHIPCCFMIFQALQKACADDFEFFNKQIALGIDVRVELPDIPMRFAADVSVHTWREQLDEQSDPLLYKEYHTPSGILNTTVRQTKDWPHGGHIPLFDDFLAPRTTKFLISNQANLAGLRHLLNPPDDDAIAEFLRSARTYKRFADDNGLLLSGGYRDWRSNPIFLVGNQGGSMLGTDALMWLCGATTPLYWAFDQPEMLEELISIISTWDRWHMELMLDVGAELIIERAWYAGTEFWSPQLYRRFIAPQLREKIITAHQAGARFGYIITSGIMPLLNDLVDLDIDVFIGIDPVQGKGTILNLLADRVEGQVCLWGGVSAPMSLEHAAPEDIWKAVGNAISVCGKNGGFILSPVDNILDSSQETWQNVLEFIMAWRHLRKV